MKMTFYKYFFIHTNTFLKSARLRIGALSFVFFLLSFHLSFAQQELGLHFMDGLWQRQKTNPAFAKGDQLVIGLPSLYSNLGLPGSYNELVYRTEDDRKLIDGDRLIELSGEDNNILIHREIETFSVGVPIGEYFLSVSHAGKEYKYWNYSKQTLELLWQGNAAFVGQTVPLEADMHVTYYHEFALGLSRDFGNVRVGTRVKALTGGGDISTERTGLSLYTDDDIYQLSLNSDYRMNTAGRLRVDTLQKAKFSVAPYRVQDAFLNNPGWAIDLGVDWKVNEQLNLSLSVLDIGQIRWKDNVNNLSSNESIQYEGLIFNNLLRLDSLNFEQVLDTIEQVFTLDSDQESYTTRLPVKFYLGASYQLNEKWRLNALAYSEFLRDEVFPSVALGAQYKAASWLILGASYAWRNDRFDNIGINGVATFGPVQIYGATDTFLAPFTPLQVANGNNRVGVNVLF
jgi:hypothetical protein